MFIKYGAACSSMIKNSGVIGRTSKIPKAARTEVLPLWNGSHARTRRGSKFRKVGLLNKGPPKVVVGAVKVLRLTSLFCASVGTFDISYLNPRFRVKLERIFQSSWTYAA